MDIFKDKLPRGWSYPLKPSRLEGAITDSVIQSRIALYQWYKIWEVDAPALSATFYPSGSHLGGATGSFAVTSCAIPSDQRLIVQDFADTVFLPALISWIAGIEALPEDSPKKWHKQEFACPGSPPALSKRPLPLINKGQPRRKGK